MRVSWPGLLVALGAVLVAPVAAPAFDGRAAIRRDLHAASAALASGCTGVLTHDRDVVFTAAHCVRDTSQVRVRFSNGAARLATVLAVDGASDQALLLLDAPVRIQPLILAPRRPTPRSRLYFEGNPARPAFQAARLDRIGLCPSLPDLPNALFTTIEGEPGDSGAPLVDRAGRVVGLVHGGARCHIATPAESLWRLLRRVFELRTLAGA